MKTMKEYEPHPFAEIFNFDDGPSLDLLALDIKEHGQIEPIKVFQEKTLDGRRRTRACKIAGVEPKYEEFNGTEEEALDYVMSKNMHRRHQSDSQLALSAAKYAKAKAGQRRQNKTAPAAQVESNGENHEGNGTPLPTVQAATNEEAAAKFGLPVSQVRRAKVVVTKGSQKLNERLASDNLTLSEAARIAQQPKSVQNDIISKVDSGEAQSVNEAIRDVVGEETPPKPRVDKNGRPKFDDRRIIDTLAKLARLMDERKAAFGKHDEHKACIAALSACDKAFIRWQKDTAK